MNQKIQKLWAAALTSGEYKQGSKHLRNYGSSGLQYCCLGVLADIHCKLGLGEWYGEGQYKAEDNKHPRYDMVPKEVLLWAGIEESFAVGLAGMNDKNYSFIVLADIIKRKE